MRRWFDHILLHARARPEQPALVMEDRVVTFGMLGAGLERCARRIATLNLPRDLPVAVLVSNPIRHMTLCLALFRVGVPSISLEPAHAGMPIPGLAAVLGDAEASRRHASADQFIEVTDAWFAADPPPGVDLPSAFSPGTRR